MALDPVARLAIWKEYEESRPKVGAETNAWIERFAGDNGFPVSTVRRVIAEGSFAMLQEINQRSATVAQQIAEMMGANMAAAFEVLREAYHATKKTAVLWRGELKLVDPSKPATDDNIVWLEVPDWHARLSAIRTTVEIFGARAPQQFEVNSKSLVVTLTDKEALAILEQASVEFPRLLETYRQLAGPGEAGAGSEIVVDGQVSE